MPDLLVVVLIALGGVAIGWLAAQLLASSRATILASKLSASEARMAELEQQGASVRSELVQERNKADTLATRSATLETEAQHLRQKLEEETARIAELHQTMRVEFENLANKILEEKSTRFLAQNQESLGALLDPLRSKIGEFRDRVETIHSEDIQSTAALREQLQNLKELNRRMSEEAEALTRALKGESKTQGSWGELVLERILERSGLQRGSEYELQAGFKVDDGRRVLPDAVIHLPEGRHIIIDAKVSLVAYERSVNAEQEDGRKIGLKEHALSIRRHVDELSRKDYPGLAGLSSPDFVMMFVPVEPALHMALQSDSELFGYAFDRNVVLVSSSTLLIALRAVESVWRRHKQTQNVLEIARQAGNLHDQFVLFVESMQDVGNRLDQARDSHAQALNRLSTGRGNLVKRAIDLKKLGARAEKQFPASIEKIAQEDLFLDQAE